MMQTRWILGTLVLAGSASAAPTDTVASGSGGVAAAETYVGASFELSNGFDGASEWGVAGQVAPLRYLELEVGTIRHDVETREKDTWLVTATARAKRTFRFGGVFAGLGMVTGEHGAANGCTSSGFIDFCGGENGTWVSRHYDRAFWIKPEFGGEFVLGPVAARMSIAPVVQLAEPDEVIGCASCDDGQSGVVFTMGLHGRIPI